MNLIPTLRIDKNGRAITRHMKPESAPVARKSIPSVALPASSSSAPAMTDSEIAAVLSNTGSAIDGYTIHVMRDHDGGDGVASAARFLMTGSDTGKKMAAEDFLTAARYVQRKQSQDSYGEELLGNVVSAWAAGNVLEETSAQIDYSLVGNMRFKHYKVFHDIPSDDPVHWRGLAVLDLADPNGAGSQKDQREFVQWAGRQDDIKRIVSIAVERGTINVDTLRGLMEQDITTPLRDGAL